MQKITPFLWFDGQAEEAMNFYVSIFPDAKVLGVHRYGEGAPMPKGTVMTAEFLLQGQKFVALNGGPHYKFSPATSFLVDCADQQEVDHYWSRLCDGGQEIQCGWLTDRYGLTWQVVPTQLVPMLTSADQAAAQRTMQAMFPMKKLDLATLQRAYRGEV